MSNFITPIELREISILIDALNKAKATNIGVNAKLYDSNGEPLGFIYYSEGGEYAFHANEEGQDV